jgi:outer membrane protein assembly factor BamA
VRKVTINGVDKEFAEAAANYVDKEQQPSTWFSTQVYNIFNKRSGQKSIIDAPSILDSTLVESSRFQIEKFLVNKGYLKAKVTNKIKIEHKKAQVIFSAVEGPMFRIRKIQDSIPDKKVANLYRLNRPRFSHIQPGGRFDSDSLAFDRDEFYMIMKRNGYYDFYRQNINFFYDSTFNNNVVDLKLIISNPLGKKEHQLYKINNTTITIANSSGLTVGHVDSLYIDSQFYYVDYSKKFRSRTVIDYIFQRKGQLYDIDKQTLTTSRLSGLNVFRNVPNPIYDTLSDGTNRLNTRIDIIPQKQMGDKAEAEFLVNGEKYGYNIGNTFTERNLFKKAAILQIKTDWSVLFDRNTNTSNPTGVENQNLRLGGNLIYPFIISPFNFPILGKYGVPHTTFSTNYQLYYQRNLVQRTSYSTSITYDFAETADKSHIITPIDFSFSKGVINPTAQKELDNANLFAYGYLIGRTLFTSGSAYTFRYHANKLNSYSNFLYFQGNVDVGGNTLYLLSRLFNTVKDSLGERTFAGRTFAQYVKGEVDFRIYRSVGGEKQFIFRLNSGVGVPYANSNTKSWIFEKEFYVGGSNDMRAWLPRTLGPGQFNRATFYGIGANNDKLRSNFKYLDQFGEVKIISNIEYRYKISNNFFSNKLRGAIFTDFGNVWRLDNQTNQPNVTLKLNNIFQSSAMDIGTGLRWDVSYFVFRLDAAFKFKDPQFNGTDQWVLLNHYDELFRAGAFKNNYKATNSGDTYNFMQLNFGVGMPF